MSFPKWPNYEEDEIKGVERVLRSGEVNFWTGSVTKNFEEEFSKFAIVNLYRSVNGSLALSCAYLAIGIKKDDEIITTKNICSNSHSASLLGEYLFLPKSIKTQEI